MAKILSFASWNVEHFRGKPERVDRVVELLDETDPDVFALYEVYGKDVFQGLMDKMSTHNFFLTENTRDHDMEILIGFRRSLSVFVTQREEFRSKVPTLRPGALVTVRRSGKDYMLLFLHAKSFPDPRSWGLRDDMFKHATSLKRKLDRASAPDQARYLCLGDLNTMGLNATYNSLSDLSAEQEIESVTRRFKAARMKRLSKTHELSWWNGRDNYAPGSQLDHVFADNQLNMKTFAGGAQVQVIGWPEKATLSEQRQWIDEYSDHALIYGEIHS
ncbi:endonuclease/exonuclease/phosphatase family protein [Aestuariirhabdus sp. Z084]|uniref:endonuclease/exonuclease/phosphatase family protein n=1 Tax=Aestuariirhabdus haliotis TaxID=2918751 RepID=UPI00201B3ED4|nr:endonuclease/exonuclease/phosphatase family protein [Aestuariirhabdus haliotis]MCL6417131.1 endonuclease/exonuclease/phosphatase family protein [Aestuariirhabdus haliotis]MCL6421081.1 endonuclease/exonuclease/phosphatase family protein [Aestuariirhabdus haliotis]